VRPSKLELLAIFEAELAAWDGHLASLTSKQISESVLQDGLSIKDTLAHLTAWQHRIRAQVEGALHNHPPRYPAWPVTLDQDETREQVDRANAWILESNRHRSWGDVHHTWRAGFLHFLELLRAIPEAELEPGGKLAWLVEEQPGSAPGVYEHHHAEHRAWLEAWLREQSPAQRLT
jgi:hypothetical protein